MSKIQAIIHYQTAMSVFKKWLEEEIIRNEDFIKIEAIIAEKYGLTSRSIYRIIT